MKDFTSIEEKIDDKQSYPKFLMYINCLMGTMSIDNELIVVTEHTKARIIRGAPYKYVLILNDREKCYDETCVRLWDSTITFEHYDIDGIINTISTYQIHFNQIETLNDTLDIFIKRLDNYGMLITRALIEVYQDLNTLYIERKEAYPNDSYS